MEGGIPRGTQVGSYVIESFLGRGGMGVVYLAYHPRLDRWSAIKLLPPFQSSSDARQRFEREARAVARLRHRHILSVFDFGEFAGQPFMAVEYMPNGSLADRMPREPLSVTAALALLRPLGDALDYAHQQGVLHRDVKPGNVFLDAEMQPVLADFGLARLVGEQSLTATGLVSGTPTHISPEQTMGRPLNAQSDLYSLAVIGFQLLTGRLPFRGEAMMDLLYAQVHTDPPAPTSINPELPAPVDSVIVRALAKDPAQRWATAAEMIGALEAAGAGRVDERRPLLALDATMVAPALAGTAAAPAGPTDPGPAEQPKAPASRRRRPWPLIAGAAAVLVLGAATAVVLQSSRSPLASIVQPTPTVAQTGGGASPSPVATKTILVNPASPLKMGAAITVSGRGLDPKRDAGAGVLQAGAVHPVSASLPVKADGSFSVDGLVPPDLTPGGAAIVACNLDAQHRTDLTQCIEMKVTIIR